MVPIPPRAGAIAAIAGALALLTGTMLHPMGADPADALAAFAEYAADTHWVGSHLTQFFGVALMLVGLLSVSDALRNEPAEWVARLGVAFGVSAMAVAAALQAVDGIALKVLVDTWSKAPSDQRANAFMAAFAARQIEIGLASFTAMLFGVTLVTFGIAIRRSTAFPTWMGLLGAIGGLGTFAGGLLSAHTGFSAIAMDVGMPFDLVVIVWMMVIGAALWRHK